MDSQVHTQVEGTGESRGVAMNLFAVLGFVAILLAGLWATVQLVKQVSRFSTDFSMPTLSLPWSHKDALVLHPTDTLTSGTEATLKWDVNTTDAGTIAFSYACRKDFYIKVQTPDSDYRAIPCNAPYTMPSTDTSLSIIPMLQDGADDLPDAPFSLVFTPAEGETFSAQGALVVLHDAAAVAVTPEPTEGKDGVSGERPVVHAPTKTVASTATRTVTKTVAVRNSDPNGVADLAVQVLDAGLVAAGKYSIKFEVSNLGTKVAEGWTFTASLPTNPPYIYISGPQQALYAGERMELLLTFDKVEGGEAIITVDAPNTVPESVETNNSLTYPVAL